MFRPLLKPLSNRFQQPLALADQGAKSVGRITQTLLFASPYLLKCLLERRLPSPIELRQLFETLGTTYIKFGQLIASTPSLFPIEYVEAFQSLLDQSVTISFDDVVQQIEGDLGRDIDEVFASIEPIPLASASIAQVHSATLHTGEKVVVKVQKPGVDTIISVDLNTAYVFTRIVELMLPSLGKDAIAGLVTELYQAMIDECDFRKERQNLDDFREFLRQTNNTAVVAPRPYSQYSGAKVLVMERLYGRAFSEIPAASVMREIPAEGLSAAMETWFASLSLCNSFHADLHNGNLLLLEDGRIGFIDFGMVGRISQTTWQAIANLLVALPQQDYRQVADAMLTIGLTQSAIDVNDLAADLEQLFESINDDYHGNDVRVSQIDELLTQLASISKRYGIRFPRAFLLLLKQFLYFERYMAELSPDAFEGSFNTILPSLTDGESGHY